MPPVLPPPSAARLKAAADKARKKTSCAASSAQTHKKSPAAAQNLSNQESLFTREQAGFAWGILAHRQAKSQNFATALEYYRRADRNQLTNDQFEWFARSALRFQDWGTLADIITSMPAELQDNPTWLYWLGRSHAARGDNARAQTLYRKAEQSGRNFYAVLSAEELGNRIRTDNNAAAASRRDLDTLARDGAIARALTLFKAGGGDRAMRRAAQAEWRYATRGFNEDTKLAAAQLAYDNQFYEMAIHTADSTTHKLNYNLRYISPFRDITGRYAAEAGIDPAWVYGLIRQESRFMLGAQSSVGAQGLMQVMPATRAKSPAKSAWTAANSTPWTATSAWAHGTCPMPNAACKTTKSWPRRATTPAQAAPANGRHHPRWKARFTPKPSRSTKRATT